MSLTVFLSHKWACRVDEERTGRWLLDSFCSWKKLELSQIQFLFLTDSYFQKS